MRFFPVFDFQLVVLLTFLGLVALVLLYMAFGSSRYSKRQKEDEEEVEEYPGGIKAARKPLPPILIFVYIAFIIWAAIYVLFIGIKGVPF
jgi:hypothetical protein